MLWVRGADDVIVSDTSLYDLAYLGSLGAVPGWPGAETWPPQPMVAQTRFVLDGYAAAGGRYREVVIADAGHGPHLDQPERFMAELTGISTGPTESQGMAGLCVTRTSSGQGRAARTTVGGSADTKALAGQAGMTVVAGSPEMAGAAGLTEATGRASRRTRRA